MPASTKRAWRSGSTTTRPRVDHSRASSSTCTSPGSTSCRPSSFVMVSITATGTRAGRAACSRSMVSPSVGSGAMCARALAGGHGRRPCNLSLFIRLRNRLEHRHAHTDAALMITLSGHAHALLINYVQELTTQFGTICRWCSVFGCPSSSAPSVPMASRLRGGAGGPCRPTQGFLTDYESGLAEGVAIDPRYEFRLRATIEPAPKDGEAVAFQFTRYDDMTDEDRAAVEEMGRKGQVITKDRKQPVSGLGKLMPKPAAAEVDAHIPFVFNLSHFAAAWRRARVRPPSADPHPERTNPGFCEYDQPTTSYRYTRAYVSHLIKKCGTTKGFEAVTGVPLRLKPQQGSRRAHFTVGHRGEVVAARRC